MKKPIDTNQKIEQQDGLISIHDAIKFFQINWKIILSSMVMGFTLSIIYLWSAVPVYEARAQLKMSQVPVILIAADSRATIGYKSIEEPQLFAQRFSFPSAYISEVFAACNSQAKENIMDVIKINSNKTFPSFLELTIIGESPKRALECGSAVIELIKLSQAKLAEEYISQTRFQLLVINERIQGITDELIQSNRNGKLATSIYLSTNDELRFLYSQRTMLDAITDPRRIYPASLISPIYVAAIPISPNKRFTLMVGLFGGFFIGSLLALAIKVKNHNLTN